MTFQPQKPKDKAATRRKTTTVRKTKTFRKKAAKKAPLRPASPQKARPTAKAAVKPAPVSPPAQPEAVRPTPSHGLPKWPRAASHRAGVNKAVAAVAADDEDAIASHHTVPRPALFILDLQR